MRCSQAGQAYVSNTVSITFSSSSRYSASSKKGEQLQIPFKVARRYVFEFMPLSWFFSSVITFLQLPPPDLLGQILVDLVQLLNRLLYITCPFRHLPPIMHSWRMIHGQGTISNQFPELRFLKFCWSSPSRSKRQDISYLAVLFCDSQHRRRYSAERN